MLAGLAGTASPLSRLGIGRYAEWKPGEKRKILLAGYNGARNTGSDARVTAIVDQLRTLLREMPVLPSDPGMRLNLIPVDEAAREVLPASGPLPPAPSSTRP